MSGEAGGRRGVTGRVMRLGKLKLVSFVCE